MNSSHSTYSTERTVTKFLETGDGQLVNLMHVVGFTAKEEGGSIARTVDGSDWDFASDIDTIKKLLLS